MFETETMAELCVQQGLLDRAAEIYRRLVAAAPDEITGARRRQRLVELERQAAAKSPVKAPVKAPLKAVAPKTTLTEPTAAKANARQPGTPSPGPAALPVPGVFATWDRRHTVVEWRLPPGTDTPALELLLVLRTAAGILTERRTMRVDRCEGRVALPVPDLHSVRVAAGRMEGDRFVPMVRVESDPQR